MLPSESRTAALLARGCERLVVAVQVETADNGTVASRIPAKKRTPKTIQTRLGTFFIGLRLPRQRIKQGFAVSHAQGAEPDPSGAVRSNR
jgi:hypothetical protein